MLTLLSLSFGGSWGSMAEVLEGGGEGALGASLGNEISALGICLSTSFSAGAGFDSVSLDVFSDGDTCVAPSADFEMIAIFVPGSTVSPSLATNCKTYMGNIRYSQTTFISHKLQNFSGQTHRFPKRRQSRVKHELEVIESLSPLKIYLLDDTRFRTCNINRHLNEAYKNY